jgi:hypothetical protein
VTIGVFHGRYLVQVDFFGIEQPLSHIGVAIVIHSFTHLCFLFTIHRNDRKWLFVQGLSPEPGTCDPATNSLLKRKIRVQLHQLHGLLGKTLHYEAK